jgi:carbon monoxide dehydrogenase subunit G
VNVNNEFVVGIPIEEAWTAMLDLERIAPCLPGASIDDQDGHEYKGTMRVKVGPITAKYQGTVRYEEVDERARRAVLHATGRDARVPRSSWRCSPLRSWPVPLGSPDRSRP